MRCQDVIQTGRLRHSGPRQAVIMSVSIAIIAGCAKSEPQPAAPAPKSTPKTTIGEEQQQPPSPLQPSASQPSPKVAQTSESGPQRAQLLYVQHCGSCHGEKGDGQGTAARFLFPKPRDFRNGQFRLVSTTNGFPTVGDIQTVLSRGMPGSSMPPWPNISKADQQLLAEWIVEFRREGIRDVERAMAAEDGEEVDEEELREVVQLLTTPGPVIEVPEIPAASPEAIERGKQLYLKTCVGCHGKEGKGDGQEKMVDAKGLPARPRDLTKGIFKGSPDPQSVYRRTQAGMPGSPMPATPKVTPEQIADLVHFVLSLSDAATREAVVLSREKIVAAQVENAPQSPDDVAWNAVTPTTLRLTPLWWRDDFEPYLQVRAVHDGNAVSLKLSWVDRSTDTHAAKSEAFEDAVAVELYRGDVEPFLGMGAAKSSIDVWMWDADRQSGAPDVDAVNPNLVVDNYPFSETVVATAEYARPGTKTANQPDLSLPARAGGNQISPGSDVSSATSLEAGGPGTVTFRPPISQLVKAQGVWHDGQWSVVMTRQLKVDDATQGVSIEPGDRISAAFAVWNGSKHDRDGQKLITIWQDLVLETDGG